MWHRPWRNLSARQLHEELDDARDHLAEIVGREISTAAFPYGSYDRRVLSELRRRRYTAVYSVDGGARPARGWLQTRHAMTKFDSAATVDKLVMDRDPTRSTVRAIKRTIKRVR
jgi:peptidoglycan/xylan/chitin deacetylase (PgdA/CDA1 family)